MSMLLLKIAFCFVAVSNAVMTLKRPHQKMSESWRSSRLQNTEILNSASKALKIQPPWNAPKFMWKYAWAIFDKLLHILHAFDPCAASSTFVNLPVIWWKAIAGNRRGSLLYDGGVAYDFLPDITRTIVSFPLCWLFPNLHHQNVALRTRYLDVALLNQLNGPTEYGLSMEGNRSAAHIVVLGAGFDTRAIRMQPSLCNGSTEWTELDFPNVIKQKQCILGRFVRRRRGRSCYIPRLIGADLSRVDEVKSALLQALGQRHWDKIIFVAEASLLYIGDDNIMPLLQMCTQTASSLASSVSFCFADRLPAVYAGETEPDFAAQERKRASDCLHAVGMTLSDWMLKPGRARHMGVAHLIK